ncbi:hypothetical protein, conserved [Eimeria brunetti]|uniref:Uncharacterized protein n=1 Tax=Eimeria brunetti TaxID=51314 RepID=U6LCS7_9EIME|nr:hypothetical protein, conserved [Eimeria brunetti]
MRCFTALFIASMALLAGATDPIKVRATPVPSAETNPLHSGTLTMGQETSTQLQRRGGMKFPLVAVAILASTVAIQFLVLQCFMALQSGRSAGGYGVNRRRLAEGGRDSCNVGPGEREYDIRPCAGLDRQQDSMPRRR